MVLKSTQRHVKNKSIKQKKADCIAACHRGHICVYDIVMKSL